MKIGRRNTIRKNKANALRLTSSAASRKAGVSREVKALKVPGGRDYASSPDLTKDETLGHALDYKGNSISLSLVN